MKTKNYLFFDNLLVELGFDVVLCRNIFEMNNGLNMNNDGKTSLGTKGQVNIVNIWKYTNILLNSMFPQPDDPSNQWQKKCTL